ncbi:MAG TPA: 5-formyltetrahydrofolate cyclo-ligase [Paracoccus solventivorans]|uniref:5-formyltetrahydrofolate cyclo-ligase n=1 Tax=Paracoccus solventivorans TaxID=53463 RepID=A0A832QXG5_9RHOB|nr:5-formyltetrahydrofolate cyclo-ligase [Paracoccus solventivorans]HHW34951.1 5-formyltetrahydrofolate cyclo-ligase [Paracoccus solventivorans]
MGADVNGPDTGPDTGRAAAKAALRRAALTARAAGGDQAALDRNLRAALAPHAGQVLSGYWPMKGEPDPRPAMGVHDGPLCLPVVPGRGVPLIFRRWQGEDLTPGPLGTSQPPDSLPEILPEVLIVPMLAFDSRLHRLGYGGGYYDRTLEMLRAIGPVTAIGLAWQVQRVDSLPVGPFDQKLDLLVTDTEILRPEL